MVQSWKEYAQNRKSQVRNRGEIGRNSVPVLSFPKTYVYIGFHHSYDVPFWELMVSRVGTRRLAFRLGLEWNLEFNGWHLPSCFPFQKNRGGIMVCNNSIVRASAFLMAFFMLSFAAGTAYADAPSITLISPINGATVASSHPTFT